MHTLSAGLQEFFLEAALATYARSASKTTIDGLPGSKVYRYERGEYLYIDTYFTNGEQSGGQTVIFIDNGRTPAWIMQYHGWCKNDDKEVLNFLKHALTQAYRNKSFCGGRGPLYIDALDDLLSYSNSWLGTFDSFHGKEIINKGVVGRVEDVFWHKFQGMTLL